MKIVLGLLCFLPLLAHAERLAPAKVEPVILEGVRYSAPNENGIHAMVRATEVATGRTLWEQEIFSNHIDPSLEEDVQCVFISSLRVNEGKIIVTDERHTYYSLDPTTRKVTSPNSKVPDPSFSFIESLELLLCAVLFIWLLLRWTRKPLEKNPV